MANSANAAPCMPLYADKRYGHRTNVVTVERAVKTASAVIQVFGTVELLEAVLLLLPLKTLLLSQRVSQKWKAAISGSQKLQQALFYTPIESSTKLAIDMLSLLHGPLLTTHDPSATLLACNVAGEIASHSNAGRCFWNPFLPALLDTLCNHVNLGSPNANTCSYRTMLLAQSSATTVIITSELWEHQQRESPSQPLPCTPRGSDKRRHVKVNNEQGLTLNDVAEALRRLIRKRRAAATSKRLFTMIYSITAAEGVVDLERYVL